MTRVFKQFEESGKNSSEKAKSDRCPGREEQGRMGTTRHGWGRPGTEGVSIRPGGMRKGRLSFASRGFPLLRNFVDPTQRHKAGRIEPAERYPASLFFRPALYARKEARRCKQERLWPIRAYYGNKPQSHKQAEADVGFM